MIQEQGVGRQLLLLLNPENQWTFFPLPFYNIITLKKRGLYSYLWIFYHLERRRDFPEPGPPDTSKGGVGGGAAIMSFSRSIYCIIEKEW